MKSTQVFLYALILVPVWTIILFVFIPVAVALLILSSIVTGDWNWKRSGQPHHQILSHQEINQEINQEIDRIVASRILRAQSLRNRKLQFESINWQRDGF